MREVQEGAWGKVSGLPEVAGEHCLRTMAEYERAAKYLLKEEQERPLPNNALIGFLCDTVRLARENERLGKAPILGPSPLTQEQKDGLHAACSFLSGGINGFWPDESYYQTGGGEIIRKAHEAVLAVSTMVWASRPTPDGWDVPKRAWDEITRIWGMMARAVAATGKPGEWVEPPPPPMSDVMQWTGALNEWLKAYRPIEEGAVHGGVENRPGTPGAEVAQNTLQPVATPNDAGQESTSLPESRPAHASAGLSEGLSELHRWRRHLWGSYISVRHAQHTPCNIDGTALHDDLSAAIENIEKGITEAIRIMEESPQYDAAVMAVLRKAIVR